MSETAAEYKTSKDEFDLQKHIEQELIKGSYDRLLPIIQKFAGYAESGPSSASDIATYAKLESLSLELARFALDYLAVKNGIDTKQPKSTREKSLEKIETHLVK